VYHYRTQSVHTLEASDPYARGLTANGERCIFVDLDSDVELMPEGWTTHDTPAIQGVALQPRFETCWSCLNKLWPTACSSQAADIAHAMFADVGCVLV
jgi:hypothetical protein